MSALEAEQGPEGERRSARRPVDMRGYLVRAGGFTERIELIDLNYGGCGIATEVELTPGEEVKITVLGRGAMPAVVCWCYDGKAGLDFDAAWEVPRKIVQRAAERIEVPGEVGLRWADKIRYRVRVLDLSTDGCKVELVDVPHVGDPMLVKFDGLELLAAEVCWVDGHTAGLKFDRHIHPAVLDLLVTRLESGGPS